MSCVFDYPPTYLVSIEAWENYVLNIHTKYVKSEFRILLLLLLLLLDQV